MNDSPALNLDDIVDELRSVRAREGPTPTYDQVRILIDDIWNMVPLSETAARPQMSEFTPEDLVSVAELFGKHRARALKQGLTGKRVRHDFGATGMLLPPPESEVRAARELLEAGVEPYRVDSLGRVSRNVRTKRNPNGFPRELFHALELAQSDWGVLPAGYDRDAAHGRDVHASLAAVLAQPATDAEIMRFVDRTYSVPTMTLEADHVRLFHWLVSHRLGHKLAELAGKRVAVRDGRAVLEPAGKANVALARVMASAYDLLEVARLDAVRALKKVVLGQTEDNADLRAALVTARWLAPGPIGRLLRLVERAIAAPDNPHLAQLVPAQVASFSRTVATNVDAFVVRSVEQMSQAHLTQVLAHSGLVTDEGEEKAAAAELRNRLIDLGLRNDLDRELPEALRAWRSGRLEEFFASRAARAEGDPEWARLYDVELDVDQPAEATV